MIFIGQASLHRPVAEYVDHTTWTETIRGSAID